MKRIQLALMLAISAVSSMASAQFPDSNYSDFYRGPNSSSELYTFEFGVGQYRPDVGNDSFDTVFGSDFGPALRLELDVLPIRLPYVGRVGVGLSAGWSKHSAGACTDITCAQRADETIDFRIWPLSTLAVIRVDVLARRFSIPLIFTGKLGFDAVVYDINSGATNEASGVSFGFRWAAQVAFELDFINPRRAASLDDEWGINHTFLFAEIFGSTAGSDLEVGTNLSWAVGLGLSF